MSKRNAKALQLARSGTALATVAAPRQEAEIFTFGEPEPVHNRRELLDLIECPHNGRWYEPPVSLDGLARAYRVSPHHSSAILLKRNMLAAAFVPSPMLSRRAFMGVVQDYLVFGNAYLERRDNMLGGALRLDHALAKFVRRGTVAGEFFFTPGGLTESAFKPGSVCQLMQPDVNQEIYGVPEYISALQSALLNEAATLFRRKYYLNGSHAGFILHATGDFADGDVTRMRDALKRSKGPGNFRNLFVHQPAGTEGGIKLLPIAQIGANDEFLGIKNTTRDDVLAAHRVPPQLIGLVSGAAGGFGDPIKATAMFHELEMLPLQAAFLEVNDWIGAEVVAFTERVAATA